MDLNFEAVPIDCRYGLYKPDGDKMRYIDFQSDSVTQPTQAMREAMYRAEVGYDVFGADPTVAKLENMVAEMTGKEAGLYVPTGTMGNQISVNAWTNRGEEIILSYDSHILEFEVGAASVISSVGYRVVYNEDSILRGADVKKAVRAYETDIHVPKTGLVCVENALGRGSVVTLDQLKDVYMAAKEHDLPVHMDGARFFNATTALGCSAADMAQYTDSLIIHLSKGLCAPVGGILVGSKDFIKRARRTRHMFGGGLSHPGFLAAAGIVALETMVDRLAEDHENARYLAKRLSEYPNITIDETCADINLVFFVIDGVAECHLTALPAYMQEKGIMISGGTNGRFRFAVHHDIKREDIEYTLGVLSTFFDDIGKRV